MEKSRIKLEIYQAPPSEAHVAVQVSALPPDTISASVYSIQITSISVVSDTNPSFMASSLTLFKYMKTKPRQTSKETKTNKHTTKRALDH